MDDGCAIREAVAEYYGTTLKGAADLKTSACSTKSETTATVRKLLSNLHDDVLARFYGCGSPLPHALHNATVLDLGCGSGRDVYVAAQMVGPEGKVIGVDMTDEQLEVATRTQEWHAEKFGYSKPNTVFINGNIEDLKACGIEDNSVDVIISNCVINLVPDKEKVFQEAWRVLKPGGELYFSDMYSDRRVPEAARRDTVLWGEGLGGALYWSDFAKVMRRVGFHTYWTFTTREIGVDPKLAAVLGGTRYFADNIRAFKLPNDTDDIAEDYGETVTYLGSLLDAPHAFPFSIDNTFVTGVPQHVSGHVAAVLRDSRYRSHFLISPRGDHRGRFVAPGLAAGLALLGISAARTVPTPTSSSPAQETSCCPPKAKEEACCAPLTKCC